MFSFFLLSRQIRGYPTIQLFAPGKKDSPIDYKGDRDLKGFNKFIKEKVLKAKKGKEEL